MNTKEKKYNKNINARGRKHNKKRIKVFRFIVSNASSQAFESDKEEKWYMDKQKALSSTREIEDTINRFAEKHDVTDIKVNEVNVHYHNNGRGNTIHLIYTVIYNETEEDKNV